MTLDRISADGLAEIVHDGPVDPLSGLEPLTVNLCMVHNCTLPLKDGALYMPPEQDVTGVDS